MFLIKKRKNTFFERVNKFIDSPSKEKELLDELKELEDMLDLEKIETKKGKLVSYGEKE